MVPGTSADLALVGGRVIDPESGLDAVRNVAISGSTISSVSTGIPEARRVVDVAGLTVAPGFIDLHSHAQSLAGARLQALDGVTTALDLEAGRGLVDVALGRVEDQGRPINFGFSAGWATARGRLAANGSTTVPDPLSLDALLPSVPGWDEPWADNRVLRLRELLEDQLDRGAIGIGVLLGYAPEVTRAEYLAVAQLAADRAVPAFTHTRYIANHEPHSSLEGMLEVIGAAAATGAQMHVCHLNSSSSRQIDQILAAVETARSIGVAVSTEAYPYGAGVTNVGAAFLAPDNLDNMGLAPSSIFALKSGTFLRDVDELRRMRTEDPSADVITHWADENKAADRALLARSLLFADTAIASDAMSPQTGGVDVHSSRWPLPPGAAAHPRSMGCYAKVFRWLVRELGALDLQEAIRRCTLVPANLLVSAVPAMARKARVQAGSDADLVVFDPDTFEERASYSALAPSVGVRHLLVGGTPVVVDGDLDPRANPGRAIRGGDE